MAGRFRRALGKVKAVNEKLKNTKLGKTWGKVQAYDKKVATKRTARGKKSWEAVKKVGRGFAKVTGASAMDRMVKGGAARKAAGSHLKRVWSKKAWKKTVTGKWGSGLKDAGNSLKTANKEYKKAKSTSTIPGKVKRGVLKAGRGLAKVTGASAMDQMVGGPAARKAWGSHVKRVKKYGRKFEKAWDVTQKESDKSAKHARKSMKTASKEYLKTRKTGNKVKSWVKAGVKRANKKKYSANPFKGPQNFKAAASSFMNPKFR